MYKEDALVISIIEPKNTNSWLQCRPTYVHEHRNSLHIILSLPPLAPRQLSDETQPALRMIPICLGRNPMSLLTSCRNTAPLQLAPRTPWPSRLAVDLGDGPPIGLRHGWRGRRGGHPRIGCLGHALILTSWNPPPSSAIEKHGEQCEKKSHADADADANGCLGSRAHAGSRLRRVVDIPRAVPLRRRGPAGFAWRAARTCWRWTLTAVVRSWIRSRWRSRIVAGEELYAFARRAWQRRAARKN